MFEIPILSLLFIIPIFGIVVVSFAVSNNTTLDKNVKNIGLLTSFTNLMLSLQVLIMYNKFTSAFQFIEKIVLIKAIDFSYHIGVDGISLLFVILSNFLIFIVILSSSYSMKRYKEYIVSLLFLQVAMIGMFISLDIIMFYIFFEAVLIPMFIIIGIWGGKDKIYASYKMFLYTFLGSIVMLVAIIKIILVAQSSNMITLMTVVFDENLQRYLWIAFFLAFAVKVPMVPFHTWLPDAHVQAPTGGSIILAGVLLKFGVYGFIRFSLPFFPFATLEFAPIVQVLSIIAVIYTSLIAFVQTDIKKVIAYSSIAHMGFVTAGVFSLNTVGIEGAIYQSISHGIVSGALFLLIGCIYDRTKTREISDYSGLAHKMPKYSLFFMIFMLASIGLPGTSGFVGEFLILNGVMSYNKLVTLLLAIGIVLSAVYMLRLYKKMMYGALHTNLTDIKDLTTVEVIAFSALAFVVILMGVYSVFFLDIIHVSAFGLVEQVNNSLFLQNTSIY